MRPRFKVAQIKKRQYRSVTFRGIVGLATYFTYCSKEGTVFVVYILEPRAQH